MPAREWRWSCLWLWISVVHLDHSIIARVDRRSGIKKWYNSQLCLLAAFWLVERLRKWLTKRGCVDTSSIFCYLWFIIFRCSKRWKLTFSMNASTVRTYIVIGLFTTQLGSIKCASIIHAKNMHEIGRHTAISLHRNFWFIFLCFLFLRYSYPFTPPLTISWVDLACWQQKTNGSPLSAILSLPFTALASTRLE